MATVVDDDVDIRNASDVEWAMATRLDPRTGILVVDNVFGHGLNPSFPNYLGAKVGFDCCKPFPPRYEYERAFYKKVSLADRDIVVPEIRREAAPAAAKAKKGKKDLAGGGQAM
jgi:2,5-furandicarboxylate decarboxylase 1